MVIGDGRAVLIGIILEHPWIVRRYPARGIEAARLKTDRHIVFRSDTVSEHVELQRTYDTNYPVGAAPCLEGLSNALFR